MLSSTTLRRTLLLPTTSTTTTNLIRPSASRYALATRQFQTSSHPCLADRKKNNMDKDSIDTDSNEYSKSGGDSAAASATDKAAFDPSKTRPEEEHETARRESGGDSNNPLNVSPANQEVSRTKDANRSGAEGSPDESGQGSGSERSRTSGGGSPAKSGGGKSGGGPL